MLPPISRPIDDLLFDAVQAHSMRTRGQPAQRVTLEYLDGSHITLPVPSRHTSGRETIEPHHWPPPEGWAFRPGEAAFNGSRFKLCGKLLAILRELAAHKGEPVTADQLKKEVWGEEPDLVEDGNVQGHVSQLRKRLRESLGLDVDVNPIGYADGAYRLTVH